MKSRLYNLDAFALVFMDFLIFMPLLSTPKTQTTLFRNKINPKK